MQGRTARAQVEAGGRGQSAERRGLDPGWRPPRPPLGQPPRTSGRRAVEFGGIRFAGPPARVGGPRGEGVGAGRLAASGSVEGSRQRWGQMPRRWSGRWSRTRSPQRSWPTHGRLSVDPRRGWALSRAGSAAGHDENLSHHQRSFGGDPVRRGQPRGRRPVRSGDAVESLSLLDPVRSWAGGRNGAGARSLVHQIRLGVGGGQRDGRRWRAARRRQVIGPQRTARGLIPGPGGRARASRPQRQQSDESQAQPSSGRASRPSDWRLVAQTPLCALRTGGRPPAALVSAHLDHGAGARKNRQAHLSADETYRGTAGT
jgi:hypothetical protein